MFRRCKSIPFFTLLQALHLWLVMVLDVLLCSCHFLSCDAGRQFLRCSIPRALDTLFPAVRTRRSYFHLSRRPLGPVPWLEPIEPAPRLLHPFVYSYLSLFTSISLILPTPCFVKNKNTVRRSSRMVFETRSSPLFHKLLFLLLRFKKLPSRSSSNLLLPPNYPTYPDRLPCHCPQHPCLLRSLKTSLPYPLSQHVTGLNMFPHLTNAISSSRQRKVAPLPPPTTPPDHRQQDDTNHHTQTAQATKPRTTLSHPQ